MRTVWRYYRFIAHVNKNNHDFDRKRNRVSEDGCRHSHSPYYSIEDSYTTVLDKRHSRRFSGMRIRADHLFDDIYAGALDEKYIRKHKVRVDWGYSEDAALICITEKGKGLIRYPFGPFIGMAEYTLDHFPKTIKIIFTAVVSLIFGLLGVWLKVKLLGID